MFERVKRVHIVGIKGVAMSGLTTILKKMGKEVTGSDVEEAFITDDLLNKQAIKIFKGFDEKHISSDCDLIIYSAAHGGRENIEVQEGIKKSIKVLSQAEVIGELMKLFKNNIAVAGTHGKTTTSSFLAYILIKLNKNPSYLIGTSNFGEFDGADFGSLDYFVVEADEYAVNPPIDKTVKLEFLNPNYIIATNIDFDHPDVYQNIEEVKSVFLKFFSKLTVQDKNNKRLFYCIDDNNLAEVARVLPPDLCLSFGFSSTSDLQITDIKTVDNKTNFSLKFQDKDLGQFTTNLFGNKNISNIAGVVLFLLSQGFEKEEIRQALDGFKGAKRRFEEMAFINETYLFDDYAHHPTEISSVISAARARFHNKRIIIIFQPHTFSRTSVLKEEFIQALGEADMAFILPVFSSAREKEGGEELIVKNQKNSIKACENNEVLLDELGNTLKRGDILFVMGAGDIYKLKNDIIKVLKRL